MATLSSDPASAQWRFPAVKAVLGNYTTNAKTKQHVQVEAGTAVYYGVYFYPFTQPGVDPVFAVVGGREVIIARPNEAEPSGIEIIQSFVDDTNEYFCTGCWTKDKATGAPLLAVGGQSRVVKVINAITGEIVRTFSGHGDEIMQIALYPCDQNIIVSTGADASVRFWTLDPAHKNQPCQLILAGEGHKETILTIAFHESGRYLLSGGMDHLVNMWVIPENFASSPPSDNPHISIYPHFATGMIHGNYVDCISFHGDLILSKSADEQLIVLWRITNFTSTSPPPPSSAAPTTYEYCATRSAWSEPAKDPGFQRLLQFSIPESTLFFMRFGLFSNPYRHSLLVMGSMKGTAYMWDLSRIEKRGRGPLGEGVPPVGEDEEGVGKGRGWKRGGKDEVGDMMVSLKAHEVLDVPKCKSTIRDVDFSADGEWMVMCGEKGVVVVCKKGGSIS